MRHVGELRQRFRPRGKARTGDYEIYHDVAKLLSAIGAIALTWRMPPVWDWTLFFPILIVLRLTFWLNYKLITERPLLRYMKGSFKRAFAKMEQEQAAANTGNGITQPDSLTSDVDPQDRKGGDKVSEDRTAQSP
jgi:hypothetical protein